MSNDPSADDSSTATVSSQTRRCALGSRAEAGSTRAPELLTYSHRQLIDLLEGYLIQLEEADTELEMPKEIIERRHSADDTNDLEVTLKEMRTRPGRQKFGGDHQECLEEIVFLAQAVFRQGRLIKNMMVM